jgi:site-specific recombinase XerD
MATLKLVLRKDKKKQNGQMPICLRITKNRKSNYIFLGYSINPKSWDNKSSKVKPSHPNSARLNSFLFHKLTEATDIALELETRNVYMSISKLKRSILGKGQESFIDYFQLYLKTTKEKNLISTYKKGKSILDKILTYQKGKALYFRDIDASWLKKYDHYLKTEMNNSINTVHSNLKVVRKLFNDAIKEGVIAKDLYPFNNYKLEWSKKQVKEYLEESEIVSLLELKLERGSKMDTYRNMFVFSCYSGGLRVSDLLLLKWHMFDGNFLNFTCFKTGENLSIKVPTQGREILNIYHQGDYKGKSNEYVFPFLTDSQLDTPSKTHNAFSRQTALYNKNLKILAKMAGLKDTKISSHWARRSFTCLALSKGMNLDVVSKILGHDGQTTTLDSYAQYTDKHLHDAMDILG